MPMNLAEAPPSPPFQQKAGRGGVRFTSLSLVELAAKYSSIPGGALEKLPDGITVTDSSLMGWTPRAILSGTTLLPVSHTHAIANLMCLERRHPRSLE
jgi:hypothetical protein